MNHPILNTHGICNLSSVPVRANPTDEAEIVTQLLFGDYLTVLETGNPWIKIRNQADNYEGWMDFKQLAYINEIEFIEGTTNQTNYIVTQPFIEVSSSFGKQTVFLGSVLPYFENNTFKIANENYVVHSVLTKNTLHPTEYAQLFLNAPYLWGGKSLHGIDCSGLIQNAFKSILFSLPRDASQQVNFGALIQWNERAIGDVAFFKSKSGNITHVGMLTTKNTIIHAHGKVRIDKINDKGIWNSDLNYYSHLTFCIKRFL